jgi:hypothetical protein
MTRVLAACPQLSPADDYGYIQGFYSQIFYVRQIFLLRR